MQNLISYSNLQKAWIAGARWAALSIYETAGLLGFSHRTICGVACSDGP